MPICPKCGGRPEYVIRITIAKVSHSLSFPIISNAEIKDYETDTIIKRSDRIEENLLKIEEIPDTDVYKCSICGKRICSNAKEAETFLK